MRLLFLLLDGADSLQRQRAALDICRTKPCWNRHRGTAGRNARLGTTLLTSRVEPGYSHTARQSGGAPQLKTKHILRSPFSSVCVSAWPARLAFATHKATFGSSVFHCRIYAPLAVSGGRIDAVVVADSSSARPRRHRVRSRAGLPCPA